MKRTPDAYVLSVMTVRYSDWAGKEIIDIDKGVRIGVVSETDLIIDCDQGRVRSIIIPTRGRFWGRRELVIPWSGIKKIGVDLIIVDMSTVKPYEGSSHFEGSFFDRKPRDNPPFDRFR